MTSDGRSVWTETASSSAVMETWAAALRFVPAFNKILITHTPPQEDKCRVCGGDGSACETTTNAIKDQDMKMGYNDLVMIPPGATNIRIAEVRLQKRVLSMMLL